MAATVLSSPGGRFTRARTNFNARLMAGGNTSPAQKFGGSPARSTDRRHVAAPRFFGSPGKQKIRRSS